MWVGALGILLAYCGHVGAKAADLRGNKCLTGLRQECLGLVKAFLEQTFGDEFAVIVGQVSLFAQAVQNSDSGGCDVQGVDKALQCGLVMAGFAGRCSVTMTQQGSIGDSSNGCVSAVKTGFHAVGGALGVYQSALRNIQHLLQQFTRKRHRIKQANTVQIAQGLRVHVLRPR